MGHRNVCQTPFIKAAGVLLVCSLLWTSCTCEASLSLRLRGGFSRTLASTAISKEVPRAHHFSRKLSGGESPGLSEEGVASIKALANERSAYDADEEEEQADEEYEFEQQNTNLAPSLTVNYDQKMHKVVAWSVMRDLNTFRISHFVLTIFFSFPGSELL